MSVSEHLLLLDLGNSRLKWAWLEHGRLVRHGAIPHGGRDPSAVLQQQWRDWQPPAGIWLAAVAPREVIDAVTDWCMRYWGMPVRQVRSGSRAAGVRNSYAEPDRLGVDRWVAMIAAARRHPDGVCVVDCGTACTLDLIDSSGRHRGGYILPGLRAQQVALLGSTAIGEPGEPGAVDLAAVDTASAIRLGGREALAALAERLCRRLAAESTTPPALLLTGGDAEQLLPFLGVSFTLVSDLVLEGLMYLALEADECCVG